MNTSNDKVRKILLYYIIPFIIIAGIGLYLYSINIKLLAPILTPLVAFIAFMGQQHQLRLQKQEYSLSRFTDTFFKLIEMHSMNVQDLKYQDPSDGKIYQGRTFIKKAYQDLMSYYQEEKDLPEGRPFKESMKKLDLKYSDNLHLYFKNLFQVFGWIYDYRNQLNKEQIILYVNVIRSQLSLNEMMILYMNTSYLKRNFFYKVLMYFNFFEKYNTDGFGQGITGIENKFVHDVEVFFENQEESTHEKQTLEPRLYTKETLFNAIENEEIYFRYQPIVDSSTKKIEAAEALMRWKEEINPSYLMAQFEINGLTADLLTYTLHYIARDIKKSKRPIIYSMNLSVHQVLLSDILNQVDAVCIQYKIPPERLQFEITESNKLYKQENIKEVLKELQNRGHSIGIDDFGNGYFSFKDFIELPIDFVKLDKEIVYELKEKDETKKTITHIVEMAKTQNIRVVIEGIESQEQYNTWKEINIDEMQGFYFSEAVDFKRLKKM